MLNSANDKSRFEGPATQEMADELERILRSRPLQNSESLRALLQYVGGRVIEGHDSAVFSYVDRQDPPLNGAAEPPTQISSVPALTPTLPSTATNKRLTAVLLGVVVALTIVVMVLFNSNRSLRIQAAEADSSQVVPSYGMFWEPFIKSTVPTMLVLSNPPVYKFVNPVDPDVLVKNSVELTPQQSSWLAGTLGEEFLTKQQMKYRLALSPRE